MICAVTLAIRVLALKNYETKTKTDLTYHHVSLPNI